MKLLNKKFPPFEKFSVWRNYGYSKLCYITGCTILRPYTISVYVFGNTKNFDNTEEGYTQAIEYFETKRREIIKYCGVDFEEE